MKKIDSPQPDVKVIARRNGGGEISSNGGVELAQNTPEPPADTKKKEKE